VATRQGGSWISRKASSDSALFFFFRGLPNGGGFCSLVIITTRPLNLGVPGRKAFMIGASAAQDDNLQIG